MTVERGLTKKRLDHRRSRVTTLMFPSTYRIMPYISDISPSGSVVNARGDPLLYNGLPDIPCRVDESKRFQDTNIFDQEAVFSAYEIFVPHDAPLWPNHVIVVDNNVNDEFEIKRLVTRVSNATAKSAIIALVDTGVTP